MDRVALLTTVAAALLSPDPARARRLQTWSYDRLLREADVMVLARAVASKDSGESGTANPWKAKLLGVNTSFKVEAVLKGKAPADRLTMLHYRLSDLPLEDGPLLVSFRRKGIVFNTMGQVRAVVQLGQPSYLLFLKRRQDGRFEPVTGQVDPALAVREVYHSLPADLDRASK